MRGAFHTPSSLRPPHVVASRRTGCSRVEPAPHWGSRPLGRPLRAVLLKYFPGVPQPSSAPSEDDDLPKHPFCWMFWREYIPLNIDMDLICYYRMNSKAKTKTQASDDGPLCPGPWGTGCGQGLRQHSLRNGQGVLAVQSNPYRGKGAQAARPRARGHPHRGCSGGWASHPSARRYLSPPGRASRGSSRP